MTISHKYYNHLGVPSSKTRSGYHCGFPTLHFISLRAILRSILHAEIKAFILCIALFASQTLTLFAQDTEEQANNPYLLQISIVEEKALKVFIHQLQQSLSTQASTSDLEKHFFSEQEAEAYAKDIYFGTEMAHDTLKLKGVTQFYHKISSEALQHIELFKDKIQNIDLIRTYVRPGGTDLARVIVVSINFVYTDGSKQGIQLNLVEWNQQLKILNLES